MIARALGLCLLLLASLAAWGQAPARTVDFDIPAQPMAAALVDLGKQAGVQIVSAGQDLAGISGRAVKGRLTVREAVDRLIEGTGLTAAFSGPDTVVIKPRNAKDHPVKTTDMGVARMPELLVLGTPVKSLNADTPRTEDDIQPYIVIDRATIERSVAFDLEGLLRTQLPMAMGSLRTNQNGVGNFSAIDLRGLGTEQTLILVDGRRIAGTNTGGLFQSDINGIPLFAIERIEVLPTTASGIYGGGATGGVINIVLRRDYSGIEAKVTYGNAFRTDVALRQFQAAGGFRFNEGNTSLLAHASYSDSNELRWQDRDFYARGIATRLANNPSGIFNSSIPPVGALPNIRSTNGATLTLKPAFGGASLGSPFTTIPSGYAGPGSDNGAALVANAGHYNFDLGPWAGTPGAFRTLLSTPTLSSADLAIQHKVTSWLDAFVEVFSSKNRSEFISNGASSSFVLAATAPSNPFNQAVRVSVAPGGADQLTSSKDDATRVVTGATFTLPFQWRGAVDYTWSRTTHFSSSASGLNGSQGAAISSGAINLFRDVNRFPIDFSPYVQELTLTGPGDATFKAGALRAGGPIPLALPGGEPTLSLLGEWRNDSIDAFPQSSPPDTRITFYQKSQTVSAIYGEILVPFISPRNRIRGVELLEAQLALRAERYVLNGANATYSFDPQPFQSSRDSVSSTNPTFGVRWKPVDALMVRTSYAKGFLPPSISQITPDAPQPAPLGPIFGVTDPRRGNEVLGAGNDIQVLSGGSTELTPERSKSTSIGLVATPTFLGSTRLSVDWTRIEKTDNIVNAIDVTTQNGISDLLNFFPQRVVRDSNPGTFGSFGIGPITAIDASLVNIARSKAEAYDVAFEQALSPAGYGTFTLFGKASRVVHRLNQLTPAAPEIEFAKTRESPLWRGTGSLLWEHGQLSAAWTLTYTHSYYINRDHSVFADQGSATVGSQTYHDLFIGYRFGKKPSWMMLADFEVQLNVANVFDRKPPIDTGRAAIGYYSPWGDPRGARYVLSLKKGFSL